ncbi:MAG: hypothetical protein JNK59_04000 [Sterolibacteriaceae bacterium]|nr:hypothetical protein [Sterolibacteriaceae bacterium]
MDDAPANLSQLMHWFGPLKAFISSIPSVKYWLISEAMAVATESSSSPSSRYVQAQHRVGVSGERPKPGDEDGQRGQADSGLQ